MSEERVKVTTRLSQEARAGLLRACEMEGVSLTALLEAVGRDLHANPRRLLDRGSDLIAEARLIDRERQQRR